MTVTVKESGGSWSTLKAAVEDGGDADISVEGTFNDLPHEATDIDWDTGALVVTFDPNAEWNPTKPRTGGSYHWSLHDSTGPYALDITQDGSMLGGEVKQTTADSSDECVRHSHDEIFNMTDMLIWTSNGTADQDGIYTFHSFASTINLTNCQICDCYRAGVNYQKYNNSNGNDTEININSCTIYNNADEGNDDCGGVILRANNQSGSSQGTVYVYDSVVCDNNSQDFEDYAAASAADTTFVIDRTVYGTDSTDGASTTITDSTSGAGIVDDSSGAGNVNVEEKDTAPYDLRLDGTSGCEALDLHSDNAGPNSMSIPATDIMGTSKQSGGSPVQGSGFDAGFFEYVAAGGPAAGIEIFRRRIEGY